MRFVSYHQYIKSNAKSSNNTRNLIKTIATKQALKLCEIVDTLSFHKEVTFGNIQNMPKKAFFVDKKKTMSPYATKKLRLMGSHMN